MNRSDEHATHGPRRRWWQDLRWITAGIVVVLLALILWGLFGPEPPITVSRETTVLTEPLAADGLPDYGAAVVASLGPAPKPEDNAAVELLQVMWPLGIDAADLPAVCTALGIPPVPPADSLQDPIRDAAAKVTQSMYEAALERPWTAAEFPELGIWLVAHEASLDRLVAAADRPRYWLPSPTLLRPGPQMLIGVLLPELADLRTVARLLVCRAMGHIGAGRHAAAWRDIRAVYRLGRLLAVPENAPQFLVTQLVASMTTGMADAVLTRGLLGAADLPADVLAAIRRDLDALGPLPQAAAGLAIEKLFGVDAIVWMARRQAGGAGGRARLMDDFELGMNAQGVCAAALLTSLDWDLVLERVNAAYDRLGGALQLPAHQARRTEWERLAREAEGRAVPRSGWGTAGNILLGCCSRGHRSVFVSDVWCALFLPATEGWLIALTRGQASFDLARTAAALAAWKAERAAGDAPYPETLDALVPKYLPAVPLDPFTETPFIYERRGDGYLLASAGQNGVYDGGNDVHGWIVGGEWQATLQDVDRDKSDIVVRMPVPPASPPPAAP
jgi:hypothetical protein